MKWTLVLPMDCLGDRGVHPYYTPRVSDGCNSFDTVCVCVSVTILTVKRAEKQT